MWHVQCQCLPPSFCCSHCPTGMQINDLEAGRDGKWAWGRLFLFQFLAPRAVKAVCAPQLGKQSSGQWSSTLWTSPEQVSGLGNRLSFSPLLQSPFGLVYDKGMGWWGKTLFLFPRPGYPYASWLSQGLPGLGNRLRFFPHWSSLGCLSLPFNSLLCPPLPTSKRKSGAAVLLMPSPGLNRPGLGKVQEIAEKRWLQAEPLYCSVSWKHF